MKKNIYIALITFFAAVFVISASFVAFYSIDAAKQDKAQQELIEIVTADVSDEELILYDDDEFFIPEYYELYTQNNDMAGWIKIEDTKINYPVMQSLGRPEYYLRRGFDKAYTFHGIPFVQENCNLETDKISDNIVIYAHNMDDGSMFGDLEKFLKKSFWEEHKTFSFDTLTQRGEYEIISVFKTRAYTDTEESFKYYHFVNASTESEFNDFIVKCKALALYDTGVSAEYGDKLVTLSTCEYSQENGRLVVVAKRVV